MNIKNLENELRADLANKLTYPRTVLSRTKSQEAKRAVKHIDEAMTLVQKWFNKIGSAGTRYKPHDKKNRNI